MTRPGSRSYQADSPAERIRINKNVWTTGINEATLSGTGVSLKWTGPNRWRADASIATRLGAAQRNHFGGRSGHLSGPLGISARNFKAMVGQKPPDQNTAAARVNAQFRGKTTATL
jgi:hypothetical protein